MRMTEWVVLALELSESMSSVINFTFWYWHTGCKKSKKRNRTASLPRCDRSAYDGSENGDRLRRVGLGAHIVDELRHQLYLLVLA